MASTISGSTYQSTWQISSAERSRHDRQFLILAPLNNQLNGDSARAFFLKSGLAPNVLGQIWTLADLNKDGKLDRKEFSIAMHLIQKKIRGLALPSALPESMKIDVEPESASGTLPTSSAIVSGPRDWSLPAASRARYSEQFRRLDKQCSGLISGVQARQLLSQSGLATQILAQIWNLSDMDKDGQLNEYEFALAMHFIEQYKADRTGLPDSTPLEFMGHVKMRLLEPNLIKPPLIVDDEPPQKSSICATFEDKRRDNFNRGQVELDRRRQLLQDQEKRQKAERHRKDKEEKERKDRELAELDRRRELEQEKAQAGLREAELQRQEEQRRMLEQRETARRELEQQRQHEAEHLRARQLTLQRQQEQESNCHAKHKHKNLSFRLQAMDEQAGELDRRITELRTSIVAVSGDIETMKNDRDEKMTIMDRTRKECEMEQGRLRQLSHDKLQFSGRRAQTEDQTRNRDTLLQVEQTMSSKRQHIRQLNEGISDAQRELKQKKQLTDERQAYLTKVRGRILQMSVDGRELLRRVDEKQRIVRDMLEMRRKSEHNQQIAPTWSVDESPSRKSTGFEDNFDGGQQNGRPWTIPPEMHRLPQSGAGNTARFRALYEFNARSDDELSFQPGDVIVVFNDHAAEPGWLAGQIRDKVGWFPEAFAECLDELSRTSSIKVSCSSPPTEPLAIIDEESFEKDDEHHVRVDSDTVVCQSKSADSIKSEDGGLFFGGMFRFGNTCLAAQ